MSAPPGALDPADLASTLEDTQASLSAALARLELMRKENKKLRVEVVDMKEARPSAFATAAAGQGPDDGDPSRAAAAEEPAAATSTPDGGGTGELPAEAPSLLPPRGPKLSSAPSRGSGGGGGGGSGAREVLAQGSPVKSARDLIRRLSTMKHVNSSGSLQKSGSQASLRAQLPTQQPLFFYHGEEKVCALGCVWLSCVCVQQPLFFVFVRKGGGGLSINPKPSSSDHPAQAQGFVLCARGEAQPPNSSSLHRSRALCSRVRGGSSFTSCARSSPPRSLWAWRRWTTPQSGRWLTTQLCRCVCVRGLDLLWGWGMDGWGD